MLLYILLSACVGTVHLYSHGVVTSACSSMSPNHDGASSQTSNPPYTVTAVPTSFKEGDEITVTLRAVSGDFEGFMLQARRVETSIPIGTFTVTNTAEAQGLNCSEVANSAVSHKSDSEKTEIIVKWKAPTSGPLSNVEFRATFVKSKKTFWEGVKSSAITYTGTSTPVTAAPTGPTSNSGCGKSKVCFSQPDNCDPTTNTACHFVSVQSSSQSEMQVQIVGPGSGYVAIGFSDDQAMGNDDIYICGKDKDGVPQVQRAFSTGRKAPNIVSLGNVTDIKTSITNGVLNCSFTSRNVISTASRGSGSQYYLMIASGPSSQGSIQEHTKTFVTQAKADLVNTTVIGSESTPVTAAPTGPTSNSGCGKSKVCFSKPDNCDPTTNTACHFVSVQSSSQSEMQVQIVGPGSGYVAIGFSDDQSMGNDDIYICGKDKDGVPQVQRAFSTGRSAPNIVSLGNVTDIKKSITNGVLNCSFTSRNVISTASRAASGSQYYLMIASGPASQGSIQEHTKTFVTQAKADLVNTTVIGSESTPVTAAPTGPTSNSGCGKSKVCFSQPNNCNPTTNTACHFVSVQSSSQSEMQVQIVGPGSGYVAIGFSDDKSMGNDDIYICGKDKDGVPQVQRAFSTGRSAPNIVSLGNVTDIKTSITNGVLNCSFTSRNVISTASRASGSQYYLMIASGPSSQGSIQEHTKTFVTQAKADLVNTTVNGSESTPVTAAPTGPTSNSGCGKSKVCFSQPDNCDPTTNTACHFVSVQSSSQSEMQVQIVGPGTGYVAIGFSDDQSMGNDDIYICGKDKDGIPQVQRAFSTGRSAPNILSLGNVTDIKTSITNGVLNCSFTSRNVISTASRASGSQYYLMIASGPASQGSIQEHTKTFVTQAKADLVNTTVIGSESTPVTAATTGPTSNSGCGKSKVCFSQPDNCDPTTNTACHFVSIQSSSQSEMQVQIVGPGSGYVAIGFSDDKSMGNDDIYICGKDKDGVPQVQRAFSTGRKAPNIVSLGNVTDIKTSITNGVLNCSFTSRNVISTASRASGSQYYLMIASGPSSQGSIQQHTNTFVTQAKADLVNTTVIGSESTPVTAAPTGPTSNSGCGKSKVCFSQPDNCDPTTNTACHFVSVQSSSQSEMQVQIVGPGSGYVAIGFSDDKSMGNDDIYICGKDKDGVPQVQRAFSTGRKAPNIVSLGNISDIKTAITNGVLNCSFTSRNVISTASRAASGSQYYLMIASGLASQGSIQEHTKTFVTQDKADLLNPTVIGSEAEAYPAIVKAHGALMLIAWMTTGSVGMLIARYLKAVGKGRGCCGKDFWFLAHVTLMSLSIIATAIAFIIVFSYAQDWAGGAHPVLGCLVMILSLIQPIVAALRCDPQHEKRFIFNWAHSFNALAIKGLAVGAIFTGLALIGEAQGEGWMLGVMGGFVAWEALLYILQDLHMRARKKDTTICCFGMMNTEVFLLVVYILGNLAFLIALLVGIGKA